MIVLYDNDCGFCRWAMAWAIRRDRREQIVAVPIQSPLGAELLAELEPSERLRSAHVISADSSVRSGGLAAADVLAALEPTHAFGQLAHALPRPTELFYRIVATHRQRFGRLIDNAARRRADELLNAVSVRTAAELGSLNPTGPLGSTD
jgi:predicted DCC family thiol-disulfide oxidoreductase YuxK